MRRCRILLKGPILAIKDGRRTLFNDRPQDSISIISDINFRLRFGKPHWRYPKNQDISRYQDLGRARSAQNSWFFWRKRFFSSLINTVIWTVPRALDCE